MKNPKWMQSLAMLLAFAALGAVSGCATAQQERADSESDSRTVRGLVDAMHSPAHSFPSNLPR